jgi:hypothetical protein
MGFGASCTASFGPICGPLDYKDSFLNNTEFDFLKTRFHATGQSAEDRLGHEKDSTFRLRSRAFCA